MNSAEKEHLVNGTTAMPRCEDFLKEFGAVKAKKYCCPNCGHLEDDNEYEMDNEKYPKYFNESKGSTMDGNYWDWTELHCCVDCKTKYWFINGGY